VTVVGGFAAFYSLYPHLCGGGRRPDATMEVADDVISGSRNGSAHSGREQLVTPSDNVLVGHVNDQV